MIKVTVYRFKQDKRILNTELSRMYHTEVAGRKVLRVDFYTELDGAYVDDGKGGKHKARMVYARIETDLTTHEQSYYLKPGGGVQ